MYSLYLPTPTPAQGPHSLHYLSILLLFPISANVPNSRTKSFRIRNMHRLSPSRPTSRAFFQGRHTGTPNCRFSWTYTLPFSASVFDIDIIMAGFYGAFILFASVVSASAYSFIAGFSFFNSIEPVTGN